MQNEVPITLKDDEIRELQIEGFLDLEFELNRSKVYSEFIGDEDAWFFEFFELYPWKVFDRFNTMRVLRPARVTSKEALALKDKYNSLVKSLEKHNFIMDCLRAEIKSRKAGDSMAYFQLMQTYLNKESWDRYDLKSTTVDKVEEKKRWI